MNCQYCGSWEAKLYSLTTIWETRPMRDAFGEKTVCHKTACAACHEEYIPEWVEVGNV